MPGTHNIEKELIASAFKIAKDGSVSALLYVNNLPFPPDLPGYKAVEKKIIHVVTSNNLAEELKTGGRTVIAIPSYHFSRVEKIKVATMSALGIGILTPGMIILALVSRDPNQPVDTLFHSVIGKEHEDGAVLLVPGSHPDLPSQQIVEGAIELAMRIGHDGFEGRAVGTIFVVGDSIHVLEKSRQLTLNPFQGYSEAEKNILDPSVRDAIRGFAIMDGAFVIREDGVVLAAGRYLYPGEEDLNLPLGLGARHAAAAGIAKHTKAIAVVVSQTSGAVRVFREGKLVLEIQQEARRAGK